MNKVTKYESERIEEEKDKENLDDVVEEAKEANEFAVMNRYFQKDPTVSCYNCG